MPRDKTATNARIIRCLKEEFLAYGYNKASLNRVSAKVGITTAGLYKHFESKEGMFYHLVEDTLEDFDRLTSRVGGQMDADVDYNPFSMDWMKVWADFIFSHYEGVKLLICCSSGSRFASFEDDLIRMEAEGNRRYAEVLRLKGKLARDIPDMQWQILSSAYIHLIFEVVRRDMTKDEALEHMHFVGELLYPGWKIIFGIK